MSHFAPTYWDKVKGTAREVARVGVMLGVLAGVAFALAAYPAMGDLGGVMKMFMNIFLPPMAGGLVGAAGGYAAGTVVGTVSHLSLFSDDKEPSLQELETKALARERKQAYSFNMEHEQGRGGFVNRLQNERSERENMAELLREQGIT